MHITCPSCQTVFAVDDDLIPAEGSRKVRCSVCENIWQASKSNSDDLAAPMAALASDDKPAPENGDDPMADANSLGASSLGANSLDASTETTKPLRSGSVPHPRQKRRRLPRPLTMAIASIAMLAIIIGGAVIWRNIVSAIFPSTIAIFETLGLPVIPDTSVIRFEAIRGERNGDTVRIRGEVVNNGIWPTHAPPIFISVQDMIGTVLAVKEVELDELVIPAGGRLPLNVQLTLDEPLRSDVDTEIVAIPVARMPGNRQ
ncbi:MAG: zinc-ribbon domain-containing protein [Proteobacteria bacterium]|nr:zinc-ribbon domain-containing protein [Pseudomonadota bacterium]